MLNNWICKIEEDHKSGELVIVFEDEMMDQVGWKVGDTIQWTQEDSSWVLTKVTEQESSNVKTN
jgi:plastocyanin|tara:strand:+ start:456 stop:647 length:192 start_codon:yes stop_codon:yes gene_type:complete